MSKIQTKRLSIIPFHEGFLTQEYVSWLNDPEVVRYSEQRHFQHTLETCSHYFHKIKSENNLFFGITLRNKSEEHIGNITVSINKPNLVSDISILIGAKNYWGNGYGTEAWKAVMDHLMREKNMRKITAGTMSENRAMLRIFKRTGMEIEGEKIAQFLWENEIVDEIFVAKFPE